MIGPAMSGVRRKGCKTRQGRVDVSADDFIFGTGRIDNPKGDGSRDPYLVADGSHPTFAAHKDLAEHIFRGIYTRNQ